MLAGQVMSVEFDVPMDANDARLTGEFYASGGSGNDIFMAVADPIEFRNWQNGHAARLLYSSGKTSAASVNVGRLKAGERYKVGFSNQHSLFSSKSVQTTLVLKFHRIEYRNP